MMDIPWVEKYRPLNLEDLVSHNNIKKVLLKFINSNNLPHLLLYGPPGTGKTSTILSIARKMYKNNYKNMILELNASDDRNIRVVRETIREFASTKGDNLLKNDSNKSDIKLVILDEADSMTQDAQFCLRRIIETYSDKTRFCMICNYINKIIPALQSRCCRLRFSPLSIDDVTSHLKSICQEENIEAEPEALKFMYKISYGDLRKAINILQGTFFNYGSPVSLSNVQNNSGYPRNSDIHKIISILFNYNIKEAYERFKKIKEKTGLSIIDVLSEIGNFVRYIDLEQNSLAYLYKELSDIEYNYSITTNDELCILSIISVFKNVIENIQ